MRTCRGASTSTDETLYGTLREDESYQDPLLAQRAVQRQLCELLVCVGISVDQVGAAPVLCARVLVVVCSLFSLRHAWDFVLMCPVVCGPGLDRRVCSVSRDGARVPVASSLTAVLLTATEMLSVGVCAGLLSLTSASKVCKAIYPSSSRCYRKISRLTAMDTKEDVLRHRASSENHLIDGGFRLRWNRIVANLMLSDRQTGAPPAHVLVNNHLTSKFLGCNHCAGACWPNGASL